MITLVSEIPRENIGKERYIYNKLKGLNFLVIYYQN